MITRNEDRPTVAIAEARSFENNEQFIARHLPLVKRLADYGVLGVALNGAKDRIGNGQFNVSYGFGENGMVRNDNIISVDAGYDLTGGLARYTPDVPSLNPLGIREIAMSKQSQFDVLTGELGGALARTATCPADAAAILSTLDQFGDGVLILKANGDPAKKHKMLVGEKADIAKGAERIVSTMNPAKDSVVIQEYMPEVRSGFADGIRYFDANERAVVADRRGLNRELRVHAIDGRPIYVVGRAGLQPELGSQRDERVFLDQASVPDHVFELASRAAMAIHTQSNAEHSYLAVDLTPDGSRVVEVNGRNIGTVRSESDRMGTQAAHDAITDALARKLSAMAHKRKGEK